MILKLRRKFIIILMCVVTLILLAVFISMLLSVSGNTRRMSENMLRQSLIKQPPPQGFRSPQAETGRNPAGTVEPNARMSILVAEIDANGEITFLTNQLHFIEEDEAKSAIQTAMSVDGDTGILRDYRLRWLKSEDGSRIALADISMEQEMLRNLIITSLMIGGAALAAFFFVSLFLSRWAVRPVELAWERQRQFVADASHELKTPLTVILSNADMLSVAETFDDETKTRRMEHIRAEASRMRKLTEDLLELAKSDCSEIIRIQEKVDLSFVMMSAVLTFEPIIYDERKNLFYDVQDSLFVMGDTARLQQLAGILLDNAVKYCPVGGQIKVGLKAGERKTAVLTVVNDGEPIPQEELAQIFERFYRVDKSRSTHGSFGLGLSIAEGIAKEHGGKIWADNNSKTGNSFFVVLPLG